MTNTLPRVEGCGVRILLDDVQAAVEEAGRKYREKFGTRPTHVSLPLGVDPTGLKLWTLNLGRHAGPGMVVVGRAVGNGDGRLIEHLPTPTPERQPALF